MRKSESKVLDAAEGLEIKVQQLDCMRALPLSYKLMAVIGPSLGRALGKSKPGASILDANLDGVADGLEYLFAHFSADDLMNLIPTLLGDALVSHGGQTGPFELFQKKGVFNGRVDWLYKAIWFALQVNFGPLFKPVLDALGGLQGTGESPSTSRQTSPPSGQPSA